MQMQSKAKQHIVLLLSGRWGGDRAVSVDVMEPLCVSTVVSESLSELEDLSFGQIGAFEVIQMEDSD